LKKTVSLLLVLSLVLMIGIFTTSVSGESELKGKILVTTHRTDKVDKELADLSKEFAKDFPGAEIEWVGIKDATQTMQTQMATHTMTDITMQFDQMNRVDFPKFFVPIDDLGITKDNLIDYELGINPSDKKLYTITHAANYTGFVYNKKVFKDAGITKTPKTWAELMADCAKIKAKGIVPFATNFKDKWPFENYCFQSGWYNTGDPNYYNNLATKGKLLVDDGGPLTMFKILRNLNAKGYLEPDLTSTSWDSFRKDFPAGKFGMTVLGSWYPPQFGDMGGAMSEVGMFAIPGSKAVFAGGDWRYAISKDSKNIPLAKAALKWLWEKGRYANAIGMVPPQKGIVYPQVFVNELLSSKLPIVNKDPNEDAWNKVYVKAQIYLPDIAQEYMLAKDPNAVVKKYNQKWEKAAKAVKVAK
jgi:raffinose/stachyose/melibiose transport system substrate-binding protein